MPRYEREYDDGDSQWEAEQYWKEYDEREHARLMAEAKNKAEKPIIPVSEMHEEFAKMADVVIPRYRKI